MRVPESITKSSIMLHIQKNKQTSSIYWVINSISIKHKEYKLWGISFSLHFDYCVLIAALYWNTQKSLVNHSVGGTVIFIRFFLYEFIV